MEILDGAAISRSPWWIDYNHAPPGAGYLHMIHCLFTNGPGFREFYQEVGGENHFVEQGFPTDFTNARITLRIKGELELRGAQMVPLIQGTRDGLTSGWALTSSPFPVTPEWSESTAVAEPDPRLWTCLGARHDRTKSYGFIPLPEILRNVNADIPLTLFPLTVAPMGPIDGDPHILRRGKDYPVWQSHLPGCLHHA